MWPDMINSGEIQSTAKAILVFDGWVWGEVRAKYRGLQRRPQELSRWQQLEAPPLPYRTVGLYCDSTCK